eukprot:gene11469-34185_t
MLALPSPRQQQQQTPVPSALSQSQLQSFRGIPVFSHHHNTLLVAKTPASYQAQSTMLRPQLRGPIGMRSQPGNLGPTKSAVLLRCQVRLRGAQLGGPGSQPRDLTRCVGGQGQEETSSYQQPNMGMPNIKQEAENPGASDASEETTPPGASFSSGLEGEVGDTSSPEAMPPGASFLSGLEGEEGDTSSPEATSPGASFPSGLEGEECDTSSPEATSPGASFLSGLECEEGDTSSPEAMPPGASFLSGLEDGDCGTSSPEATPHGTSTPSGFDDGDYSTSAEATLPEASSPSVPPTTPDITDQWDADSLLVSEACTQTPAWDIGVTPQAFEASLDPSPEPPPQDHDLPLDIEQAAPEPAPMPRQTLIPLDQTVDELDFEASLSPAPGPPKPVDPLSTSPDVIAPPPASEPPPSMSNMDLPISRDDEMQGDWYDASLEPSGPPSMSPALLQVPLSSSLVQAEAQRASVQELDAAIAALKEGSTKVATLLF